MIEIFTDYLKRNGTFSLEDLTKIESLTVVKKLRKRQYLLQAGDVWKYNAFITTGCLRTYSVDEKGHEHVLSFAIENWWVGDRESLQTGEPSAFNIDAIEDAQVALITKANFNSLCQDIPALNTLVNSILQKSFVASQKRIHSVISLSAEEKYLRFMEQYPQLSLRVPQGMIASYLGITPETLSRVRKSTAGR